VRRCQAAIVPLPRAPKRTPARLGGHHGRQHVVRGCPPAGGHVEARRGQAAWGYAWICHASRDQYLHVHNGSRTAKHPLDRSRNGPGRQRHSLSWLPPSPPQANQWPTGSQPQRYLSFKMPLRLATGWPLVGLRGARGRREGGLASSRCRAFPDLGSGRGVELGKSQPFVNSEEAVGRGQVEAPRRQHVRGHNGRGDDGPISVIQVSLALDVIMDSRE
jgi:hypothetical protein